MVDIHDGLSPATIERYNKTNTKYKKKFGKTFNVKNYRKLCEDLGFCFSYNDKNFRMAWKYYSLYRFGGKGWNCTNSKQDFKYIPPYAVVLMNGRKGYFYGDNTPDFSDNVLIHHTCSQRILNNKVHYWNYMNKQIFENNDYSGTLISFYNIRHTVGACYKSDNNVIHFDIDDHEHEGIAEERLEKLLKFLNVSRTDAIMMEKSVYNGGIHICFKLPFHIIDNKWYKELDKIIKENIKGIDTNFSRTVLRLPLSYEYNPINLVTGKTYQSFKNFYQSINLTKTIDSEVLNNIEPKYTNKPSEEIKKQILRILRGQPVNQQELSPMARRVKNLRDSKKCLDYWKSNVVIIQPKFQPMTTSLADFQDRYKITAGNRHNMFQKLVPLCVKRGLNLQETVNFLYSINVSSKDISKSGKEGIEKSIKSYYEHCYMNKDQYNSFNDNRFISNIKYIPTEFLSILNEPVVEQEISNLLIKEYISVRNQYEPNCFSFSEEKIRNMQLQFPQILKEVIGSFYFQFLNLQDKLDRCKVNYYRQYIGFQLPSIHLLRIVKETQQNEFVSSNRKYCSYNIQYLKKAFFNILGLKSFQLKQNGKNCLRNYRKGFCTSYVNDLVNMFRFFVQLSKKLKYIKGYNRIFSFLLTYINNYITLEANLLKKQDFQKLLIKVANENGLDPPKLDWST